VELDLIADLENAFLQMEILVSQEQIAQIPLNLESLHHLTMQQWLLVEKYQMDVVDY